MHWLPEMAREFVLYIPMVHLTEMMRHGYYGNIIPTYESVSYVVLWNTILSFVGLTLVRQITRTT